jgi:hypothetical protein
VPLGQNLSVRTHTSAIGVTLEVSKPLSMITTVGFSLACAGVIPSTAIESPSAKAASFFKIPPVFMVRLILILSFTLNNECDGLPLAPVLLP